MGRPTNIFLQWTVVPPTCLSPVSPEPTHLPKDPSPQHPTFRHPAGRARNFPKCPDPLKISNVQFAGKSGPCHHPWLPTKQSRVFASQFQRAPTDPTAPWWHRVTADIFPTLVCRLGLFPNRQKPIPIEKFRPQPITQSTWGGAGKGVLVPLDLPHAPPPQPQRPAFRHPDGRAQTTHGSQLRKVAHSHSSSNIPASSGAECQPKQQLAGR